jgi:carbonic anhydrase
MPERQSPVDIPPQAPLHRDGLELRYGPIPLVLGRHPSAIQVDCTREASALIDETRYELDQFHIHCPSEHTFGGAHAPLAVHLVHRSAAGRLAVVAVLFEEGPANAALAALIAALDETDPPTEVDLDDLLPSDRAFVAYDGSLTTPPFTEGVAWRVFVRASTLSAGQLEALRAVHCDNIRPVQPLNEREFL